MLQFLIQYPATTNVVLRPWTWSQKNNYDLGLSLCQNSSILLCLSQRPWDWPHQYQHILEFYRCKLIDNFYWPKDVSIYVQFTYSVQKMKCTICWCYYTVTVAVNGWNCRSWSWIPCLRLGLGFVFYGLGLENLVTSLPGTCSGQPAGQSSSCSVENDWAEEAGSHINGPPSTISNQS